jgi:hypothetical protein
VSFIVAARIGPRRASLILAFLVAVACALAQGAIAPKAFRRFTGDGELAGRREPRPILRVPGSPSLYFKTWCRGTGSNCRHQVFQLANLTFAGVQ